MIRMAQSAVLVVIYLAVASLPGHSAPAGTSAPSPPPAASSAALAEARALIDAGRYTEAESAAEGLSERYRSEQGSQLAEARALDLWVEARWRNAKAWHEGTLEAAQRAAALKAMELGPASAEVADSVLHQARVLDEWGRFEDARNRYEEAIDLYRQSVGAGDPRTALASVYLGGLLVELGQLRAARPHLEGGLEALEPQLGSEHPYLAEALVHLGWLEAYARNLELGRGHFERALSTLRSQLGTLHPAFADPLDGLAWVLQELDDFEGARRCGRRAAEVRNLTLGPEHASLVPGLVNLWWVEEEPVRRDTALDTAKTLAESAYPPGHPIAAVALSYSVYIRPISEAWTILERALQDLQRAYGPSHWRVSVVLANTATIMWSDVGDLALAREFMDRSIAIRQASEVRGGLGHTLAHRTSLYLEMGLISLEEAILAGEHDLEVARGERARSFYLATMLEMQARRLTMAGRLLEANTVQEEALRARGAYVGPDHFHFGDTLWQLAEIRAGLGDFESALALNRRALSIHEAAPRRVEMELQRNLHLETSLLWAMGRRESSGATAQRLERVRTRYLLEEVPGFPERQALSLTGQQLSGRDFLLSLAITSPKSSHVWSAADAVVRSRAIVLDSLAERNTVTKAQGDAETRRLDRELARARETLARLVVGGPEGGGRAEHDSLVRQSMSKRDQAERELAARSRRSPDRRKLQTTGLGELPTALPERSALLSYVRFDRYRQGPASWPLETSSGYLAIVVRADQVQPNLLDIGPAPEVDRRVGDLRRLVWQLAMAWDRAPELSLAQYERSAGALREAIWDPVAPALEGLERVFIVPDGELNLVNWGALPTRQGGYLIEQPLRLHYLSAERDLVGLPERPEFPGKLLAMGDPAFDETDLYAALAAEGSEVFQMARLDYEAGGPVFRGRRASCGGFADLRFEELPAAASELRSIEASWSSSGAAAKPVVLRRAAANEAAFKARAPGSRVAHLATHGFYLGGDCGAASESSEGGQPIENPLLLSGLALAGANHRQAAGPEEEDGVLTAEEIAALDLQGVEWAVLSGCETGVGEARAGEGVFGLRRAFQIAGARTVIMSLWPVDDEATRDWMAALYLHRFVDNASTVDAVRSASLDLLAARRQAGLSTHPFYWAGFVAAGDWR